MVVFLRPLSRLRHRVMWLLKVAFVLGVAGLAPGAPPPKLPRPPPVDVANDSGASDSDENP
jgi:hypothetical protein